MKNLNVSLDSFQYSFSYGDYDIFYNVFEDGENFDLEYIVVDLEGDLDCTEYLKTAIGSGKLWNLVYQDYQSRFEEYY